MTSPTAPRAPSRTFHDRAPGWRRAVIVGCLGCLGVAVVALNHSTAADAPPAGPNVNRDEAVAVSVVGPVDVQGSMEIVNDALKTPFAQTERFTLEPNAAGSARGIALPPGKRLVIETVTVSASVPNGQDVLAQLTLQNAAIAHLATRPLGTFGASALHGGTHPVTFRLNTNQTPSIAVEVGRSAVIGTATFRVSLFGYTEDI
jgi:hypothetical protein